MIPSTMRRSFISTAVLHLGVLAAVSVSHVALAFVPPAKSAGNDQQQQTEQQVIGMKMTTGGDDAGSASEAPANLVGKDAFVAAIDVLKRESGVAIDPEEESIPKMYAIGRLETSLPLEMASGISMADCEHLTLINGLHPSVAEATGIQPLDTIVSISAGEGEQSYSGDVSGKDIDAIAKAYTEAIEFAVEKGLKAIELEVNRLVTLQATSEGPINGS